MPSLWRESRQLGPDQLRFTERCHTRGCKGDAKLGSDDEFVSSVDFDGLTEELFISGFHVTIRTDGLIDPGRIEEVDAKLQCSGNGL